ncbi:MAG: hypothetical protein LBL36_03595, partial [Clostridiales Family XIII bacterium]|nr:hypothetical protein [Clostridiales Family XIII bacterium]
CFVSRFFVLCEWESCSPYIGERVGFRSRTGEPDTARGGGLRNVLFLVFLFCVGEKRYAV